MANVFLHGFNIRFLAALRAEVGKVEGLDFCADEYRSEVHVNYGVGFVGTPHAYWVGAGLCVVKRFVVEDWVSHLNVEYAPDSDIIVDESVVPYKLLVSGYVPSQSAEILAALAVDGIVMHQKRGFAVPLYETVPQFLYTSI